MLDFLSECNVIACPGLRERRVRGGRRCRMFVRPAWLAACVLLTGWLPQGVAGEEPTVVRFATFNCSLSRDAPDQLARDLQSGEDPQARDVARILRHVRPQVLLLNEFDFQPDRSAVSAFHTRYLNDTRDWCDDPPLTYPYVVCRAVNTGVPSGRDLDKDGTAAGAGDAFGYGRFPGQYGMVVLSMYPVDEAAIRTFRNLLWRDVPDAVLPPAADGSDRGWYDADDLAVLRLSSKSHWDVPVRIGEQTIHVLASHPVPPVFDGPEDRNGRRNHDEIRFWADYLSAESAAWIRDDRGRSGGPGASAAFLVMGDLNADPFDGDGFQYPVRRLLRHPRVNGNAVPVSAGAEQAAMEQGGANATHRGPASADTADFSDSAAGNLRVDYVLPSRELTVTASGVFWPVRDDSRSAWIACSDHRLVWCDIAVDTRSQTPQDSDHCTPADTKTGRSGAR